LKNIIERQTSTVDSRQKVIVVTDQGRALEDQAASVPEALSCKIKFNPEEALMLKKLTEKLYSAI
jgi:DNA-binding MarR family transcriptional regulator